MAAHYIELNATEFEAFLQSEGFNRGVKHSEVVYAKEHGDKTGIIITCYTSIADGDSVGRACGSDAIRITAVFYSRGKGYPLFRGTRVHRTSSTASVIDRVKGRIAEAVARCDQWLGEQAAKRNPNKVSVPLPHHAESNRLSCNEDYGKLRETVRITVEVMDRTEIVGKYVFTMRGSKGHSFRYVSDKDILKVGETYDISAKIVGYRTTHAYQNDPGVRQTELRDVKGKRVVL